MVHLIGTIIRPCMFYSCENKNRVQTNAKFFNFFFVQYCVFQKHWCRHFVYCFYFKLLPIPENICVVRGVSQKC